MGYKNVWLIVEEKGTAQCKWSMLNMMEGEEMWHEQEAALFVVFSISQNLEVEFFLVGNEKSTQTSQFYKCRKNPTLP